MRCERKKKEGRGGKRKKERIIRGKRKGEKQRYGRWERQEVTEKGERGRKIDR